MLRANNNSNRDTIVKSIKKVEELRKRKLFCLCLEDKDSMDKDLLGKINEALPRLGENNKKISVLINSLGGDIHSTFKMINSFYQYVNDFEAITVDYAKSAATFFCLGAKKILMSKNAELGPLDAQLPSTIGSAFPKSAINVFKSLEYLRRYTFETLDHIVLLLLGRTSMDIPEALKRARSFVSDIINPLYKQVKPMELGESGRKLAVAEEYCVRIMKRYGYSDLPDDKISEIAKHLVWEYPSHNFVIDLFEATSMGLNTELLDEECTDKCINIILKSKGCFGFLEKREGIKNEKK